jgi:hypothetical protein
MKKSERNLLIVTLVVAAISGAILLRPEATSDAAAAAAGDLETVRRRFHDYATTLEDEARIRSEFNRIGGQWSGDSSRGPRELFTVELSTLLQQRGFQMPPIQPPRFSKIENVEDYCTVDVELNIVHAQPWLIQLLREMERRGMLIKEFNLSRVNARDPSQIALRVKVARVIKQTPETRRILNPGYR